MRQTRVHLLQRPLSQKPEVLLNPLHPFGQNHLSGPWPWQATPPEKRQLRIGNPNEFAFADLLH